MKRLTHDKIGEVGEAVSAVIPGMPWIVFLVEGGEVEIVNHMNRDLAIGVVRYWLDSIEKDTTGRWNYRAGDRLS